MSARRTIAHSLTAAASAALLAIGFAGNANAAIQYAFVYQGGSYCVADYSEVTPTSGGALDSGSEAWDSNCTNNYTSNVGTLAVNSMPLWYDFGSSTWIQCSDATSGWQYNEAWARRLEITRTGLRYLCGSNKWYANNTGAYAYVNGGWKGDWLPSGNEWVTDSSLATSKPPAEPKFSAAEAVRTGQVRIGSPTGPKATQAQLRPSPGTNPAGVSLAPEGSFTVSAE
ncbi:hypothetical protein [Streptomyces sp. NPDC057966]|uniref:hypothetical protein n=1 Tax=Streptomyces sp. NPDC057966 TaxID=3346292 RepID=UPI0036EC7FDC